MGGLSLMEGLVITHHRAASRGLFLPQIPPSPSSPAPCMFSSMQVGGMVLHEGQIAEMATGEGKTLVATLPVYLNALRR